MPLIPCQMKAGNLLVISLDACIKSESGRPAPLRRADWVWVHSSLPEQLKTFVDIGYTIVMVDIIPHGIDIAMVRERCEQMIAELVFDPWVILAKEVSPHLWTNIVQSNGGRVGPHSMFCGDAGPFADMTGLIVMPPSQLSLLVPPHNWPAAKGPEVVIMVGPPKSGKTRFIEQVLKPKGYWVQTEGTDMRRMPELLALGISFVVDGCHPTQVERERIRDAVFPYPCRVAWITRSAGGGTIEERTYAVEFERPQGMPVVRVD